MRTINIAVPVEIRTFQLEHAPLRGTIFRKDTRKMLLCTSVAEIAKGAISDGKAIL
jgi:hypothetical protein